MMGSDRGDQVQNQQLQLQSFEDDLSVNFSKALNLESSTTGLICSEEIAFLDLSLSIEGATKNGPRKESHTVLHFSQPAPVQAGGGGAQACLQLPHLENVDISLISDKLPPKFATNLSQCRSPFFLVKFWADLNFPDAMKNGENNPKFYLTTRFQSASQMKIEVKTQICTFGSPIWEKVEAGWEIILIGDDPVNRTCYYESYRTPLCSYVVNFIDKLCKDCPDINVMNGVLENFSAIQVLTNKETGEDLLTVVYVFEVCSPEQSAATGAMFQAYRLSSSN